jgi:hypothetical protein
MTTLYQSLRERAQKSPKDQFMAVPIVPPLGMMIAAAEMTDVFRPGDQLWEYFENYDTEHDLNGIYVDQGLISRFGIQKAFVIACLADIWGACLEGVDIWLQDRGRSGHFDANRKEELIHYVPDRCPPGGWPLTKEEATDEHKLAGRCATEPFSAAYTAWWGDYDRERVMIAPKRLPYRVATIAARADLSVAALLEVPDAIALSKTPFIPCWTKDSYYADEETYELVVAAMWRGAVAWLLGEEHPEAVDFPFHPTTQAVILSNFANRERVFYAKIERFFYDLPYQSFEIETEKAKLSFEAKDGVTSFRYQQLDGPRRVQCEGISLRVGKDNSGFGAILRSVCRQKITRISALPLKAPDQK